MAIVNQPLIIMIELFLDSLFVASKTKLSHVFNTLQFAEYFYKNSLAFFLFPTTIPPYAPILTVLFCRWGQFFAFAWFCSHSYFVF